VFGFALGVVGVLSYARFFDPLFRALVVNGSSPSYFMDVGEESQLFRAGIQVGPETSIEFWKEVALLGFYDVVSHRIFRNLPQRVFLICEVPGLGGN
jgi:hypothetical protein